MNIRKHIKDLIPEMNQWRHYIHENPEIAYEEHNTSDFIATKLTEFNIEILGKDTKVKAQTYHAYESAFIKYYEQNYNEKPILCCNSDPDY